MENGKRWIPALGWMSLIYYLSSRTGSELGGMFPFFSSLDFGHLIAYFVLSLLFYWALIPYEKKGRADVRWIAVLLCFLYGLSDEWHQSFVPQRTPDGMDILNDVIGAALAMLLVTFFRKKKG